MIRVFRAHQAGFTLVELMISTAVFATVLMVISMGLLQIGRTYYKGVTTARTQEAARTVSNEITSALQFGGGALVQPLDAPTPDDGSDGFCVGGKRFSYILNRQLVESAPTADQSRHVLVLDDNGGSGTCAPGADALPVTSATTGRELLGERMRLAELRVFRIGTTDTYRVFVRVVSGDNDLLDDVLRWDAGTNRMIAGSDGILDTCKGQQAGTQFCAASELNTVVQKRVR